MTRGATVRPPAFDRRLRASIALRKAAVTLARAHAAVAKSPLTGQIDGRRSRRLQPEAWSRIIQSEDAFEIALQAYANLYRKARR